MFSTANAQSVTTTATATPGTASSPAMGGDLFSMGLPLIFMLAIYLLVIRPHNKRLQEQKKMVDTLKVGDEIVTTAGLLGVVSQIKENHIHLKVTESLELLFQRQSVQHILPKGTVQLPAATLKLHKNS